MSSISGYFDKLKHKCGSKFDIFIANANNADSSEVQIKTTNNNGNCNFLQKFKASKEDNKNKLAKFYQDIDKNLKCDLHIYFDENDNIQNTNSFYKAWENHNNGNTQFLHDFVGDYKITYSRDSYKFFWQTIGIVTTSTAIWYYSPIISFTAMIAYPLWSNYFTEKLDNGSNLIFEIVTSLPPLFLLQPLYYSYCQTNPDFYLIPNPVKSFLLYELFSSIISNPLAVTNIFGKIGEYRSYHNHEKHLIVGKNCQVQEIEDL